MEAIKERFGKKEVEITVKEVENNKPVDQKELFRTMEELRERFKDIYVYPSLNLSDLANEVNL
ncbi:hypothetical protein [Larkinella terrae]|uniref:Uncharacterized protein n=1 Tax=Larkinella terrae TaxID=2025311 RepID=A0A7K0EHZ8_9BACT|nr:hypothetical protein [Larkinella terrae]MRS61414.1 hypothetical protein [Larkinella terrae]